jgi:hypothetical protein
MSAAMKYFFGDADLLHIFFVGIGMVGIYDTGWISQVSPSIHLMKQEKVFKMIVGNALTMFVDGTS